MTTAPTTPSHHEAVLNDFIDLGHRLVRLVVEQAEAGLTPAVKAAAAYDRVTRSVRRSMLMIRELAKPITDRVAIRKRVIRVVEDTIQRSAAEPEARILHRELLDRLDSPDWNDELGDRPIDAIIDDIVRDLGLADALGHRPWKRRTPADLAQLTARAAAPARHPSEPAYHHRR